jgi:hypothetical protein
LHRFSDFAEERQMEGQKVKMETVVGKEITVTGYRVTGSKYHDGKNDRCMTLQFELNNTVYVLFTGSNVLISQMERYKDEMPFLATIQKIDKFYSFT